MAGLLRSLFSKEVSAAIEPTAFPPPYRRMVAINSDVEFTTWSMQIGLFRALAERKLETSSSYWFFGDTNTTWNLFDLDMRPTQHAAAAFHLMRSGLLDTVHSFAGVHNGRGCRFDRGHIRSGYERLAAEGLTTRIYSNHGTIDDIQNVGGDWVTRPGVLDYPKGDVPGSERYHLDLSLAHGIRYFWVDIDRAREPVSFPPVSGEALDCLFVTQVSRDGNPILRFRRTDTGVQPDGANLDQALERVLGASDGGFTIVYTHLGVKRDSNGKPLVASIDDIPPRVFELLDSAAADQAEGRTLFTTTERLLNFALMMAARPWSVRRRGDRVMIRLEPQFLFEGVAIRFGWRDFMGFAIPIKSHETLVLQLGNEIRSAERWVAGGTTYAGLRWQPIDMGSVIEEAERLAPV